MPIYSDLSLFTLGDSLTVFAFLSSLCLGLCTDNFVSGRPAGRREKLMLNRGIGSAFFISVQPDNPFVKMATFFSLNSRAYSGGAIVEDTPVVLDDAVL